MRSRPSPGFRRLFAALVVGAAAGSAATSVAAQRSLAELTRTPEDAASLFLRSVRAVRWSAAAQFIHAETLERFRTSVTLMSDADASGEVREYLTGADSAEYAGLSAPEVFERSIGRMVGDMPGLMHAFYDRDDEVLGHVAEGDTAAHVVYRTTARISGAVPEIEVMQLRRTAEGWRVLWSRELEVLEAALRGIPRGRAPAPPGPAPAPPPGSARGSVLALWRAQAASRAASSWRTGARPWKSLRRSPSATSPPPTRSRA